MELSAKAIAYLRVLNGETIPMSWSEASVAIVELVAEGLAHSNGHMILLTEKGRLHAQKFKHDAKGSMP